MRRLGTMVGILAAVLLMATEGALAFKYLDNMCGRRCSRRSCPARCVTTCACALPTACEPCAPAACAPAAEEPGPAPAPIEEPAAAPAPSELPPTPHPPPLHP